LHIDNLSEFLRLLIKNEDKGLYFPQNEEYVNTSDMVKMIAEVHGKNIKLTRIFNPILKPLISRVNIVNKVYGNLVYDRKLSKYAKDYCKKGLKESIVATER